MRRTVTAIIAAGSLLGAVGASASTFELYQGEEVVAGPCGTFFIRQFDSNVADVLAGQNPGNGFVPAGSQPAGGESDSNFAWRSANLADFASGRGADLALTMGRPGTTGNAGDVDDGSGGPSIGALAWPATIGDGHGTSMDPFSCTSCRSNDNSPASGTLEFPINSLDITPASFSASGGDEGRALAVADDAGQLNASDIEPLAFAATEVPAELAVVPEPATILLLASGLLATAAGIRRRRA